MNTTPQNSAPSGPGPRPADSYARPVGQQPRPGATPAPGAYRPAFPQPMMKPLRAPWWQREGVVSKLIVLTGAGITLIGVVMLLVIAAHAGLLDPQVRVGGGAALSVLLIAAALRIHGRPGGTIGGAALAGTGIAGLFIVTVSVTSFYHWIPPLAGLAVAGTIAAVASVLAVQWRSELLAIMVTVAVAALAPVLTSGVTVALVWFLIILQAAGVVPERLCQWVFLGMVRQFPATIAVALYVGQVRSIDALPAAAVLLVLATVSFALPAGKDDELHGASYVLTALPLAMLLPMLDEPVALSVGGVAAVVLAGAGGVMPSLSVVRRVVLGAAALTFAVETSFLVAHNSLLSVLVLVPGLAVTAVASVKRTEALAAAGAALGVAGGTAYLTFADPAALSHSGLADTRLSYTTMAGGLMLVLWAVLAARVVLQAKLPVPPVVAVTVAGICGLYGATAALVSFGSSVAGTDGFHSAHLGVTLLWITVAMSLMAISLRVPRFASALLAGGLLLTGCSVAKLFLFDLQAMTGATRAITFIVAGLVMLFAGSRYAQAFARMRGAQREAALPPAQAVQH